MEGTFRLLIIGLSNIKFLRGKQEFFHHNLPTLTESTTSRKFYFKNAYPFFLYFWNFSFFASPFREPENL